MQGSNPENIPLRIWNILKFEKNQINLLSQYQLLPYDNSFSAWINCISFEWIELLAQTSSWPLHFLLQLLWWMSSQSMYKIKVNLLRAFCPVFLVLPLVLRCLINQYTLAWTHAKTSLPVHGYWQRLRHSACCPFFLYQLFFTIQLRHSPLKYTCPLPLLYSCCVLWVPS